MEDPFLEFNSVKKWTGRLNSDWAYNPILAVRRWCLWLKARGEESNPDKIIEWQSRALGNDRFRFLDLLQEWVNSLDNRASSKASYYSYVRGFFVHNRCELPRDASFRISSRKSKYIGSLTVDDVRRMLNRCSLCYRAVFLCMVMGGMGSGELVYWSDNGYESLVSQLDSGARAVRVDLPGRKHGRGIRPFYTFIGSDAVKALKQYLEIRKPGAGPIFYNQFGGRVYENILTEYWRRQLVALGLRKVGEHYGKNLHEVRDLFRSRWQKSGADGTSAEFFMGHIIDANGYNKAFNDVDYARGQYELVEKWLNIVSNDPEKVPKAEVDRQMRAMEERQTLFEESQRRINEDIKKMLDEFKDLKLEG